MTMLTNVTIEIDDTSNELLIHVPHAAPQR